MVFVAVISIDEVLSGTRITEAGARRKTGWLGHGAGVDCNAMRLLRYKRLFLVVQPEAVAGDSDGVDVVLIVFRLDDMKMDRQRHGWR